MKQKQKERALQFGRTLILDKQTLPIYQRFTVLYGPVKTCTLALLLIEGLSSGDRENTIAAKINERKVVAEKNLCVTKKTLSIHNHLVAVYGTKRIYGSGLLLINDLSPDNREHLVSLIGAGEPDIGKIQETIQKLFNEKE
jgi:hypothetical protein